MKTNLKPWEIVSDILKLCASRVKPGITTLELDEIAEKRLKELGGESCNKGYKPEYAKVPYPATICTSVNDVIVHGVPNNEPLRDGDIVNIDIGVKKDGLCGDASLTVGVGELSNRNSRLIYYAKKVLEESIKLIKPGVEIREISRFIENYSKSRGFEPNIWYGGHGIGKEMHEAPFIHNIELPNIGKEQFEVGKMYCIEPIITFKGGDKEGYIDKDGWSFRTRDGKNSAFFEHQVLITKNGCEILTTHI